MLLAVRRMSVWKQRSTSGLLYFLFSTIKMEVFKSSLERVTNASKYGYTKLRAKDEVSERDRLQKLRKSKRN